MPALVAGIHVWKCGKKGVDGRDKRAFTPVFDGLGPAMTWKERCPKQELSITTEFGGAE
jgi:hypothetical protein